MPCTSEEHTCNGRKPNAQKCDIAQRIKHRTRSSSPTKTEPVFRGVREGDEATLPGGLEL